MKDFKALAQQLKLAKKAVVGVVWPDQPTLKALFSPVMRPLIEPILIGDVQQIKADLKQLNESAEIVPTIDEAAAAKKGVELIQSQNVNVLMKGLLPTGVFLKAIVDKENGIAQGKTLAHVTVNELPSYPKLLATADGGMLLHPSLAEKQFLVDYTVGLMQSLGVVKPKVALLAAAEEPNPKIPATLEAKQVADQAQSNSDYVVAGPISLDLAIDPQSVRTKGYQHPVAGQADILIGPDITVMNVLGKSMTTLAGGKMAGLILGAAVPIIVTSRGSTTEEKTNSLLLALYIDQKG